RKCGGIVKQIHILAMLATVVSAGHILPLPGGVTAAQAAVGDTCFTDTDQTLPGKIGLSEPDEGDEPVELCVPFIPESSGYNCGQNTGGVSLYYNEGAGACVANNATCTMSEGGN